MTLGLVSKVPSTFFHHLTDYLKEQIRVFFPSITETNASLGLKKEEKSKQASARASHTLHYKLHKKIVIKTFANSYCYHTFEQRTLHSREYESSNESMYFRRWNMDISECPMAQLVKLGINGVRMVWDKEWCH